ncbi:MAG: RsmD family RNA methyltransferase [Bacteroidota bacterium]
MRIISGKYKGKRILAPKKLPVRPTTAMAKEGLFNILNNRYDFNEIKVIDLFSGTGNISYEFASRGTQDIMAVDAHAGCIQFIAQTAKELNLPIRAIKSDVKKYLNRYLNKADLIFADPPYHLNTADFTNIITLVFEKKLLLPDGTLIIEHAPQTDLTKNQLFVEKRKYGSSVFSFFTH